jgi:hypothetical protein
MVRYVHPAACHTNRARVTPPRPRACWGKGAKALHLSRPGQGRSVDAEPGVQDVDTCAIRWAMTKARDAIAGVFDDCPLLDALSHVLMY